MSMTRRRLPIGIQTFREIREEGCYYVDKTAHIRRLLDEAKHYFLSRPRRFGKSLFLDTCKELFEGNEPLFEGLHIHEHWDWSARHPVVRLDFSSGNYGHYQGPEDLRTELAAQLKVMEDQAEVTPRNNDPSLRFGRLLEELHERTGRRVAVLVDEYEKPVLDNLDTPETARAIRDYLFGFYATIKSSDADIQFSLLTGVHKFPLAGPFSGLNNLIDITLDPRYSAICGFTDSDLDAVFAPELPGLDREEIRAWYNGYKLVRRGKGLQPLRHPAALRQARVRRLAVRDGHPVVRGRNPDRAGGSLRGCGRDAGQPRLAVLVRRGGYDGGGAAVPGRLHHDHGGTEPRQEPVLSSGLSQPRRT